MCMKKKVNLGRRCRPFHARERGMHAKERVSDLQGLARDEPISVLINEDPHRRASRVAHLRRPPPASRCGSQRLQHVRGKTNGNSGNRGDGDGNATPQLLIDRIWAQPQPRTAHLLYEESTMIAGCDAAPAVSLETMWLGGFCMCILALVDCGVGYLHRSLACKYLKTPPPHSSASLVHTFSESSPAPSPTLSL